MEINKEIWKEIKNFPDYEISSFGKIRKKEINYIFNTKIVRDGFLTCYLTYNKKRKAQRIHKLVVES